MKAFLLLSTLLISLLSTAQNYDGLRYRDKIFATSTAQNDVQYGSAPQWVFPYWNEDLFLNVYTPTGDNNTNRPLIIFAHAGGFLNGNKDVDDMVALCDSFARKGYVTATIDYRKGFNPVDAQSAERAVYRGIQDGKAAVRYFKEYASTYNIDTNNIFFGGMSAGGYISLHVAYMDKETERPGSTYGGGTVNDLGCLDCAGNNYNHTSEVKAILDYWGAVQDTSIIESGDTPVMIMHGENDPTVPFVYGHPFGLPTLPQTYGGQPISERVQNLGIPYEFYTSQGQLHMLDGSNNGTFDNPPNSFWSDTLLPRTTDFLIAQIEPHASKLSPDTMVVCYTDSLTLEITDSSTFYYEWGLDPSVNVANTDTSALKMSFSNSGIFDIYVLAFNELLCAGDTLWYHVEVLPEVDADFNYTVSNFTEVQFNNNSSGSSGYTWDFGDGNTSTDSSPSHNYLQNGSYDVQLIANNDDNCQDTITQAILIEGLSTEDFAQNNFDVYPNPFQNHIVIQTIDNKNEFEILIVDINGKIVFQQSSNVQNMTIDTEEWSNGMYFITLFSESKKATYKIVKTQ